MEPIIIPFKPTGTGESVFATGSIPSSGSGKSQARRSSTEATLLDRIVTPSAPMSGEERPSGWDELSLRFGPSHAPIDGEDAGAFHVSLHIHERISTRAILDAVHRPQPLQLELFGETPLPTDQQIEFYQHEVGWANRLILGDSLLVMSSLLIKEGMAGKVQMIYIDPLYGIKYASNFQPRIDRRNGKEKNKVLKNDVVTLTAFPLWEEGRL